VYDLVEMPCCSVPFFLLLRAPVYFSCSIVVIPSNLIQLLLERGMSDEYWILNDRLDARIFVAAGVERLPILVQCLGVLRVLELQELGCPEPINK